MVPTTSLNSTLEQTRSKLEAWRQRNKAPRPIPDDIWRAAVELSHQLGLGTVSRELKLDYGSLKRKANEPAPQAAEFFELLAAPMGLIQSCVIQIQSTRCQATVQLDQVTPQAVGSILREVLL